MNTYSTASNPAALQMPSTGADPRQRIIEAFAQTHRRFFQADELEQIVEESRTRGWKS